MVHNRGWNFDPSEIINDNVDAGDDVQINTAASRADFAIAAAIGGFVLTARDTMVRYVEAIAESKTTNKALLYLEIAIALDKSVVVSRSI